MKKPRSPERNAAATLKENCSTLTSKRGRRAISSLWYAVRTIQGAKLTADDLQILRESIGDILIVLEGQQ